jgi:g-D-glutamyl-meso-diaminopimelate peptidase
MKVGVRGRLITPQPVDYGVVRGLCTALQSRYDDLSSAVVGRSVLGREIPALVLSRGPVRQRVLMAAAFHAQEWMTALVCLRLCEDMAASLERMQDLDGWNMHRALRGRGIVLVPLVNPDGVQIALHGADSVGEYAASVRAAGGDEYGRWQANVRGVDLNHNFNAGWQELQQLEQKNQIFGPAARRYGGTAPESEPETRALADLCRRGDFSHVAALHSQGEEIYWQYGTRTPPCAKLMASVMASVSGYTVAQPQGLAAHGGFKDWFIESTGRPGFTIELGKGENPLPLSEFESIYAKARELLLACLLM